MVQTLILGITCPQIGDLLCPFLIQFNAEKTSISSHRAANLPFLCAPMPCVAVSLHTLCSNHGVISIPIVKPTIPGGHGFVLAPKIWANVVQTCILDDTCGYIGDLLGPLLTQFNIQKQAIPATQRPTSRSCVLQCLALRFHCTQCAQIVESLMSQWQT